MLFVLATICSTMIAGECRTVTVTDSSIVQMGMGACSVGAPAIADWVLREHPAERLQEWRCVFGSRAKAI